MQVRYKYGTFSQPITVTPGDLLILSWTEEGIDAQGKHSSRTEEVSEDITISAVLTHYIMFYVPGCPTIGGMFGTQETIDRIGEIFHEPYHVQDDEPLMGF